MWRCDVFERAEEHSIIAIVDTVVMFILLPNAIEEPSAYDDTDKGDWKEAIVPELRVIAMEHERVLAVIDEIREFDLSIVDNALYTIYERMCKVMEAEEKFLFPILAPYLGGEDVGPIRQLLSEHETIRLQYSNCMGVRKILAADSVNVQKFSKPFIISQISYFRWLSDCWRPDKRKLFETLERILGGDIERFVLW